MSYPTTNSIQSQENTYTIPLNKGKVAIVDECDADLIEFTWSAKYEPKYHRDDVYVARRNARVDGKQKTIRMHREIMERIVGSPLSRTELVDHKNGDTLDNRRSNLRIATKSLNAANAHERKTSTSPYKGVTLHKKTQKWQACIRENNVTHYLGLYEKPEDAHAAYCEAAVKYFGEFANFGTKGRAA